jgi:replicative DNA helicase
METDYSDADTTMAKPPDLCRRPTWPPATPDRLPPHSPEGEQGILGCIFLSPTDCMGECVEKIGGVEMMYDLRHTVIYNVMLDMYDARESIDVITVMQKLKDAHQLEQVGGIAYLSQLPDTVPSAANLSYYITIVKEKYLLRKMIQTCTAAMGRIYDYEGDVDELLDQTEGDILKIRGTSNQAETTIKEYTKRAINSIEADFMRQGACSGIETGFTDFDRLTGGLQNGDYVLIAARPSVGKSSIVMNIAEHVAIDLGLPVGVFSLEMTGDAITKRIICSRARINLRNLSSGLLAERDFPKLTSVAGKLSTSKLFLDDRGGISVMQLRAKARRWHQQHKIKLLVIDYLQLLSDDRKRHKNQESEISAISSAIKALAKELNIPIIVLSQLNRELEKDKKRKPRLADLRGSGSLEQDGDLITFLYAGKEDDEDGNVSGLEAVPVNWLIAKARNGPANIAIPLTFLKAITRFASAAKVTQEDMP